MFKNRKKYIILFLATIAIVVTCFFLKTNYFNNPTTTDYAVAAKVNDEYIYVKDIERILFEYDETESITFDTILNNSIDELLIVQYGKKKGFTASSDEIDERELFLKNNMPDIYEEIASRGIEEYRKNLSNLIIYDKITSEYFKENHEEIHVTDEEALKWYKSTISDETNNFEKYKELIISSIEEEKERKLLGVLIDNLKKDSDIIIYEKGGE